MATSTSQLRATKKYIREKLDEIKLRVPKGQREVIQQHAARQGESVNGFITRAVRETIKRDNERK